MTTSPRPTGKSATASSGPRIAESRSRKRAFVPGTRPGLKSRIFCHHPRSRGRGDSMVSRSGNRRGSSVRTTNRCGQLRFVRTASASLWT